MPYICFPDNGKFSYYEPMEADELRRELKKFRDFLAAKERTVVGLEDEIEKAEKRHEALRMLMRCEISKQLCSYERNRPDHEGPCNCAACVAALGGKD